MTVLTQFQEEHGPISPALGKTLAQQVIAGDHAMLHEAVMLLAHEDKEIRGGAAMIIQQVAMVYPQRVAPYLARMLPALESPELQTRWMLIHSFGLCAAHDRVAALRALPIAQQFIRSRSGVALWNATIVYLGNVGAISAGSARQVLPLLEQALRELPDLTKAALESCLRLLDVADDETAARISRYCERYSQVTQPGIKAVLVKMQKRLSGRLPSVKAEFLDMHIDHAVLIRTAPERIFDCLATSEGWDGWFTTTSIIEPHPGGELHFYWVDWGPDHVTVEDSGKVIEARRPERFVFEWHPDSPDYATMVEIDLQLVNEGTVVRLRESGYLDTADGRRAFAKCATGWGEALTLLKFFIEHGLKY